MTRLHLVRHGRAAAGFDRDHDPGLDDVGRGQAAAAAAEMAGMPPLALFTSPLRRCRETARPFADAWGVDPVVVPEVGEIESPTPDLAERGQWLRGVMAGRWADQEPAVQDWRRRVVDAVLSLAGAEAVVVTHFVAINVVVGHARGDDRVVVFAPDNCSRTEIEAAGGRIEVVRLGRQADTQVR